jgi:hypothetical protein
MRAKIKFRVAYHFDDSRHHRYGRELFLISENKMEQDLLKHWLGKQPVIGGSTCETKKGKVTERQLLIRFEEKTEDAANR